MRRIAGPSTGAAATRRRALVGLGAAAVGLFGAGTALAYWTAQGSAAAVASTGSLAPVTVAAYAGESVADTLYPGGPAGDVVLKVTNPNPFTVTLVAVAANGPVSADAGHPACTTTGVTFQPPANPSITIAAGAAGAPSTRTVTLAGAASMGTTSSSACQGATFHVPVSITVHT